MIIRRAGWSRAPNFFQTSSFAIYRARGRVPRPTSAAASLGHSTPVAANTIWQVTDADYGAVSDPPEPLTKSVQKPVQLVHSGRLSGPWAGEGGPRKRGKHRENSVLHEPEVTPTELEPCCRHERPLS